MLLSININFGWLSNLFFKPPSVIRACTYCSTKLIVIFVAVVLVRVCVNDCQVPEQSWVFGLSPRLCFSLAYSPGLCRMTKIQTAVHPSHCKSINNPMLNEENQNRVASRCHAAKHKNLVK